MSWFYGKGLTNLATTAIKEAQKKIDQVFDIRDEDDDENGNSNDDRNINGGTSNIYSVTSNKTDTVINKDVRKINTENEIEIFMPSTRENQMITTPPKPGEMVKQVYDLNNLEAIPQSREQENVRILATENVITDRDNNTKPQPSSIDDNININLITMGATDETTPNETETVSFKEEDEVETPRPSSTVSIDYQSLAVMEKPAYELQAIDSDSTYSFEDIQIVHLSEGSMELRPPTTSPHSNDELETTTSSDIEIISNPNGDGSSSANSNFAHRSPLKLMKCSDLINLQQHSTASAVATAVAANTAAVSATVTTAASINQELQYKGHCREPSEVSILSVDSRSEGELEKLINRISELNNTIEALELRLLDSSRQNCALQEQNKELQAMVCATKQQQQPSDEYMKRLSSLEKKLQASKQECNTLRSTINELQNKMTKTDLTEAFNESQEIIVELKQEGEKLSKEILQQSNIIKKLRSKEKTTDAQLKTHKDQLLTAHEEIERLKKTLNAREDMERSQIEAVNKLSSDNQKLEKEKSQLNSKLEDLTQKLNTLQHSFNAVKTELQQRSKQHTDLTRTTETIHTLEKEKAAIQAENQELQKQLHELRENLRLSEQAAVQREQRLRDENRQLISRCEIAELRAESSTQEMSQTTIPLMRHLESLQQTLNQRTCNWNEEQKQLLGKLETYQKRLQALESGEATAKEENVALKARCTELEEKLRHAAMQGENLKINYQLEMKQNEITYNKQISALSKDLEIAETKIKSFTEKQQQLQYKLDHCENELSKIHQNATNANDNTNANAHELSFDCINNQVKHDQQSQPLQQQSPRTSASHNSFDDAMGISIDWREDDLECVSNSGRPLNIPGIGFSVLSQNNAGTLEHLQSLLKQKDGEITHCQWEISRLNADRNVLQDEMSQLTLELEQMTEKLQNYEMLENNYNDLQTRYDALLQMYGEKVERTEELELDLKECKEAYKTQIQELLIKLKT